MFSGIKNVALMGLLAGVIVIFFMVSPADLAVSRETVGPPAPIRYALSTPPPTLFCQSAFLLDNHTSEKLFGKDEYAVRSIASITKLITALVFLDLKVDWDKTMMMDTSDANNSSRSPLRAGDVYKVRDLFHCSLMSSDNRATRALARSTGVSLDSFIVLMNNKVDDLGLFSIKVDEVTGLSVNNVSNAADCARLLNIASSNETIQEALQSKQYTFFSEKRRRPYVIGNTNRLLSSVWDVKGGKTGHILEAGYCFVARVSDAQGHDLTAVVLGAKSNSQRFKQAVKLLQWAFSALEKSKV
jgi:D-alanyl-D-alanine carboxypeptidase